MQQDRAKVPEKARPAFDRDSVPSLTCPDDSVAIVVAVVKL